MRTNIELRVCGGAILGLLVSIGGGHKAIAANPAVVASQPVGLIQIPIIPGANCIAAPLHRIHSYRGQVLSTTTDSLTVAGTPAWTTDQFGRQAGSFQFIVIVLKSTSPDANHEGDWWPVQSNSANSLTVFTRSEDLTTVLQAGDRIEVRHLTTLKDLFGTGPTFVLNKDSNGVPSAKQEDLIRFVSGTSFSATIFYHDGSMVGEGYYSGGAGPMDGSTITLWPDQPLVVFRRNDSPNLVITCRGQVPMTRFTHYLQPGANALANPFPTDTPVGASGLMESGWLSDNNGVPSTAQEDILRPVTGTSLGPQVFHHDGSRIQAGWYVNGTLQNGFPIEPAKGYILFINGSDGFIWHQPVPGSF